MKFSTPWHFIEPCVPNKLKIEGWNSWHTFRDLGNTLPISKLNIFRLDNSLSSIISVYCQCSHCTFLFFLLVPRTKYPLFRQKRLDDVIRNVTGMPSKLKCTTLCCTTNGCHTVNIMSDYGNTCQLTTGLSNETEMINDKNGNLYVRGMNVLAI